MAFLKRVGEEQRGRFKKMDAKLVPYFDEKNEFIVPKPPPPNRKRMVRFHYMKTIKEEVEDLPLSHDLAYFVAEWLEEIVMSAAHAAENNALKRGDDRITAAHWPPNTDLGNQDGYWEHNREYAKDYKEYLKGETDTNV